MKTRVCKKCGVEKRMRDYRAANGRICDKCQTERKKKWVDDHSDYMKVKGREYYDKKLKRLGKKRYVPMTDEQRIEKRRERSKIRWKKGGEIRKKRTEMKYSAPYRVCTRCGENKKKEEFASKRGIYCKDCRLEIAREYRNKNKEKSNQYQRNHYKKYRDRLLAEKNEYDAKHKEHRSIRDKKRRELDPSIETKNTVRRYFAKKGIKSADIPEELFQYKTAQLELYRKLKNLKS